MTNRTHPAVSLTVPSEELEAAVDAVVALCEGDQRAALRALVAANDYLNADVERLQELISKGYARSRISPVKIGDGLRKVTCPT
jgi:replication-associated recombination protein RarA